MEQQMFALRLLCAALIIIITFFIILWRTAKEDLNYYQSAYTVLNATIRKIVDEEKSGLIMPGTIGAAEDIIKSFDNETP